MTLTRPHTTRALRGSALGLGLLVAAGATATPALAMTDGSDALDAKAGVASTTGSAAAPLNEAPAQRAVTGTIAPDFGRGKSLEVQVTTTGPVPDDLDLSGAEFLATQTNAAEGETPATGTCITDQFGTCYFDAAEAGSVPQAARFPGTDDELPVGEYSLVQVSSSPGLDPIGGAATFEICAFGVDFEDGAPVVTCDGPAEGGEVPNASLFRTEVTTVVTDEVTGAPLAGATYDLTGPDYPHQDADVEPDPDQEPAEEGVVPSETEAEDTTQEQEPETQTVPEEAPAADDGTDPAPLPTEDEGTVTDPSTDTGTQPGAPSSSAGEPVDPGTSSADSSAPLPFAGPGSVLSAYQDTVTFGRQTSAADGSLTFTGWFLPEPGYTLTPVTGVDGYRADTVFTFAISTTSAQAAAGESFPVSRELVPAAAPTTSAPSTSSAASSSAVPAGTRPSGSALATTGSPVETMTLVGLGMLALGGAATATGTVLRRRARQHP